MRVHTQLFHLVFWSVQWPKGSRSKKWPLFQALPGLRDHQHVPRSLGREATFPLCPGSTEGSAPGQANYHIFVSGWFVHSIGMSAPKASSTCSPIHPFRCWALFQAQGPRVNGQHGSLQPGQLAQSQRAVGVQRRPGDRGWQVESNPTLEHVFV